MKNSIKTCLATKIFTNFSVVLHRYNLLPIVFCYLSYVSVDAMHVEWNDSNELIQAIGSPLMKECCRSKE